MLFHRHFCIGLLAVTAVPAYGQRVSRSHLSTQSQPSRTATASAESRVNAVVLPVEGANDDSLQTIISRDLSYGDRVAIVTGKAQAAKPVSGSVVVKAIATPHGVKVSLLDAKSGALKQQRDFPLPQVATRSEQAIADSLNQAFAARDLLRRTRITRAMAVRDSLQLEMAKKAPRFHDKQDRESYAKLVAERNDLLLHELGEIAVVTGDRERDEAGRAKLQAATIAAEGGIQDSLIRARRWAIHGVSDDVEEWITGHRGIAQSRIAYVSDGVIRIVDFDGANDHAVTHAEKGATAMSPAWRRDGGALVYSQMSDAGTQIATVDLSTGQSRLLGATPRGLNITPIFSADDRSIIYANGSDARTSLVAAPLDGPGTARHLPLSKLFDADEPILSPDGTRIAYVSSRPKTPQIYSARLDGTDERVEAPAIPGRRVYHTSPDWSPDGRMIAYQQQNGDFQVWLVTRANHKVRRLTHVGENEDPSWAPDARHIALTSNRSGAKAIWVLDIQTGHFRQLTHAGDARLAAWSGVLGSPSSAPLAVAR